MKKVLLTSGLFLIGFVSFAQQTKALVIDQTNQALIGDFNPTVAAGSQFKQVMFMPTGFVPRDFIYDSKNGKAIFQDKSNGLIFCQVNGEQIVTRSFELTNTVMAPAYMPAEQKVVCFNIQKEANGYGNNEDNLFFSTIDVNTGLTKNLIQFKELSFDNVTAPFYGKISMVDRFTQKSVEKEIAASKPLYIAEKGLYMVMMRDVTGTNRLYKIRVNSPKAAVASNRCNFNIVDMAHVVGTDIVKTLFFENQGNMYNLMVGDMNILTNEMSNTSVVKTFNASGKTIINNGSIEFNRDMSQLYVTQFDGSKTNIYSLDLVTNGTADVKSYAGNVQFDFGFTESSYQKPTYTSVYKLYPNPAVDHVIFRNQTGVVPNSIMVYDNIGQVVKVIEVKDALTEVRINMEGLKPGVYYVKSDIPGGEDFYGKVILTQ